MITARICTGKMLATLNLNINVTVVRKDSEQKMSCRCTRCVTMLGKRFGRSITQEGIDNKVVLGMKYGPLAQRDKLDSKALLGLDH